MTRDTISISTYLETLGVFHWAYMRHFDLWFTGQTKKPHRRSRTVLKRLATRKHTKVRAVKVGKKIAYALKRKSRGDEFAGLSKLKHGIACTECLVRVFRSNMNC